MDTWTWHWKMVALRKIQDKTHIFEREEGGNWLEKVEQINSDNCRFFSEKEAWMDCVCRMREMEKTKVTPWPNGQVNCNFVYL